MGECGMRESNPIRYVLNAIIEAAVNSELALEKAA